MNQADENNNSILLDQKITSEDILWPQKIDIVWVAIMSIVSLLLWFFVSTGVLLAAFVSSSKFSVNSWIQPFMLAMSTFFMLTMASVLYILLARSIFPAIYTRVKQSLKYISVFMIILYFAILPNYLLASSWENSSIIVLPYLLHIMFAVFGIELLLWVISSYRYVVLSFFSNTISFMLSSAILLLMHNNFSTSWMHIFVLMWLSALTFFLATTIIFLVKFLYYKYYTLTWNDPLWSIFSDIENQENIKLENAKNSLLQK